MKDGELAELDHHKAMTGPDLVQFVDLKLFPYLASFKQKASDNPKSIEYKIGEIFSELKNKVKSGYNLREIIEMIDELLFGSSKDNKQELSHLYETKIKNMGNAGRNGGQYYTPRPLIRAMIEVINPQMVKRYMMPLAEVRASCAKPTHTYMTAWRKYSQYKTLQENTFYGKEKNNRHHCVMNMILPVLKPQTSFTPIRWLKISETFRKDC